MRRGRHGAPPPAQGGSPHPDGDLRILKKLLPYIWPKGRPGLKLRLVAALIALLLSKLINIIIPIFYKYAVDALAPAQQQGAGGMGIETLAIALPLGMILAYGGARFAAIFFNEIRNILFARIAMRTLRKLALNVFRHLHALSLRFHLDRQTGGLSRVIERGSRAIETLMFALVFNLIPLIIEILLVIGILWGFFDISYVLVILASIALYVGFTLLVTRWRIRFRREMNESDNRANTRAIDSLLNYETVKYFGNEEHEAARYDISMRRYEDAAVMSRSTLAVLNAGQAFIIAGSTTVLMLMAAHGIMSGTMTVGDFVLVNTYLIQLYQPLNFLGWVYHELRQGLVDLENMTDLLEEGQEIADAPDAKPLNANGGAISFDEVSFSYDGRRSILEHVGFDLPAGKTLALVGHSGAGKSTVARLLYRFYDPASGRILIDGQDIRDITQASLRAAIGVVPQDTVLFNDTIRYNIAYGRPGASESEVIAAAEAAHIRAFIESLPDGWDTAVGERGLKLSGGEKQRVSIARALLKAPRILIFDEATSALDSKTEQEIQANLREISQGVTTLIIAHRLSTVTHADEILVLEDGIIAERGKHADLLKSGGLYASMWERQQAKADTKI